MTPYANLVRKSRGENRETCSNDLEVGNDRRGKKRADGAHGTVSRRRQRDATCVQCTRFYLHVSPRVCVFIPFWPFSFCTPSSTLSPFLSFRLSRTIVFAFVVCVVHVYTTGRESEHFCKSLRAYNTRTPAFDLR